MAEQTFTEWKDEILVELRKEGYGIREMFYLIKNANHATRRYHGVVTEFAFERGDTAEFAVSRLLRSVS